VGWEGGGSKSVKEMMGELRLPHSHGAPAAPGQPEEALGPALRALHRDAGGHPRAGAGAQAAPGCTPARGREGGGREEGFGLGAQDLSSWYPQDHRSSGIPNAAGRRRSLE